MDKKKRKTVTIDSDLHRQLKVLAFNSGVGISECLDTILLAACENGLDDVYRYGHAISLKERIPHGNYVWPSGVAVSAEADPVNIGAGDEIHVSGFNGEPGDGVYTAYTYSGYDGEE